MGKLSKEQKVLIVTRLACFSPPAEIIKEVHDRFGVVVSSSQISFYNPDQRSGRLSKALSKLFIETRERLLGENADLAFNRQRDLKNDLLRVPVCRMWSKGYPVREIAEIFDISPSRVRSIVIHSGLQLKHRQAVHNKNILTIVPVANIPTSRMHRYGGIRLNLLPIQPAKMIRRASDKTAAQHAMELQKSKLIDTN